MGLFGRTVLLFLTTTGMAKAVPFKIVKFDDTRAPMTREERDGITANFEAAAKQWGDLRRPGELPITVAITVVPAGQTVRLSASPTQSVYRETVGGHDIYESCASHKVRYGKVGEGCEESDITVLIDLAFLRESIFIDPTPDSPSPIPADRVDLVTVLAHELGHGLGIDGWRDSMTGALPPGGEMTVYDTLVSFADPKRPKFLGANVRKLYGKPMPIYFFPRADDKLVTYKKHGRKFEIWQSPSQNIYHYGRFTRPNSDNDYTFFGLMAGSWVFTGEARRGVGELERAILKDLGY